METSIKSGDAVITEYAVQLIYIFKNTFSIGYYLKMFIRETLSKTYKQERINIASISV